MLSKSEANALIAQRTESTGSLTEALTFVSSHLLSKEVSSAAVNIFPRASGGNVEPRTGPNDLSVESEATARSDDASAAQHLYRCRGMVQEMQCDVSLYCASRQNFLGAPPGRGHCTSNDTDNEEDDEELLDAVVLYVIPVPGNTHFYSIPSSHSDMIRGCGAGDAELARRGGEGEAFCNSSNTSTRKRLDRGHAELAYNSSSVVAREGSNKNSGNCNSDTNDNENDENRVNNNNSAGRDNDEDGWSNLARTRKELSRSRKALHASFEDERTGVVGDCGGVEQQLNITHPALAQELQTACIVTVILPKMQHENVKDMYGHRDTRDSHRVGLRVNDVVDFYGYMHSEAHTSPPTTGATWDASMSHVHHSVRAMRALDSHAEDDEVCYFTELPHTLVPRLVCLAYVPITSAVATLHSHSPQTSSARCTAPDAASAVSSVPRWTGTSVDDASGMLCTTEYFLHARQHTLQYLSRMLCEGDELVAEYVLLHLCSKVTAHNAVTPVGDVPLLVYSSRIDPALWSAKLRQIAPVAELLLNRAMLDDPDKLAHPRHDVKRNYLRGGLLQVGNGTHITVDCRGFLQHSSRDDEGDLPGARAVHTRHATSEQRWHDSLFAAVHRQVLLLDYPFHTLEVPIDVSFLALLPKSNATGTASCAVTSSPSSPSSGPTSPPSARLHPIFDFALQIHWQPSLAGQEEAAAATDSSVNHNTVRLYLARVRDVTPANETVSSGGATMESSELQARVTEAFVRRAREVERWHNRDSLVHNNTFSVVMAMLRTQAASLGRGEITQADLDHVMHLELLRLQRA